MGMGIRSREHGTSSQLQAPGATATHHGTTTTSLNSITPCAACKLLRRRCAEECPFSPYFSPHEPHKFAAVHKVFGASNISKLLMEVPETQRADAANSLVYEANLRLRDPVYGCMGAISALQQQIQSLTAEVNAVRAEILKYKYREATINLNSPVLAGISTANNNNMQAVTLVSSPLLPSSTAGFSSPADPIPLIQPPPSASSASSNSSSSASSLYATTPSVTTGYIDHPYVLNLSSLS